MLFYVKPQLNLSNLIKSVFFLLHRVIFGCLITCQNNDNCIKQPKIHRHTGIYQLFLNNQFCSPFLGGMSLKFCHVHVDFSCNKWSNWFLRHEDFYVATCHNFVAKFVNALFFLARRPTLWQYRLWSFNLGNTKLDGFLAKIELLYLLKCSMYWQNLRNNEIYTFYQR